jgi:hypothetical protein
MTAHKPKYVKTAKMFVVTTDEGAVKVKNTVKRKQTQHWFSEVDEANDFYKQSINQI